MSRRADLIELAKLFENPLNWGKGELYEPDENSPTGFRYCLAGGMGLIAGTIVRVGEDHRRGCFGFDRYQAMRSAVRQIILDVNPDALLVTSFNDDPDTTHADVMAVLYRAIENTR